MSQLSEEERQRRESDAKILPSHSLSVDLPNAQPNKPTAIRHASDPAYESPLRHHQRAHSNPRHVKETLHARSEYTNSQDDGGTAVHRINQYTIKEEIGRGSFGAVHLAVDQYGTKYAVKEFSKSRLRRRAQSNILRFPHAARKKGHIASGLGFNAPLSRQSTAELESVDQGSALSLIKEEIAIMKKLNHGNLVSLIEVLDDPREDSLYMVLEMCEKGVIMKIGVDERADPYDEESCRCWFRDLILGIEYLHAQGVIHRDIKPDNLLLTNDDVLKIVDFGVSEMFEKESQMLTAKSAGSPAFLPPELCVAKHGDVSGKAADIWSMGVTLYCLMFGELPFQNPGVLELYNSIQKDPVHLETNPELGESIKDLIQRLLEKDPVKRIQMEELREHPWVTKDGNDLLLSVEENTANLVEPPTKEETDQAITSNLGNVLVLMKAVKKFKNAVARRRPVGLNSILGEASQIVQPPTAIDPQTFNRPPLHHKPRSVELYDRKPIEGALAAEGLYREPPLTEEDEYVEDKSPTYGAPMAKRPTWSPPNRSNREDSLNFSRHEHDVDEHPRSNRLIHAATFPQAIHHHPGKGQAHNPLEDHLYLSLGTGSSSRPPSPPAVSESPPAAEIDIYETAYRKEVERIRESQGRSATLFLTRRVDKLESTLKHHGLISHDSSISKPYSGIGKLIDAARASAAKDLEADDSKASILDKNVGKVFNNSNTADLVGSASSAVGSGLNSMYDLVSQAKAMGKGVEPQHPPSK